MSTSVKNLIQDKLENDEEFLVEEVPIEHCRVGLPKKKLTKYRLVNRNLTKQRKKTLKSLFQRACNTLKGKVSYLLPHSSAENVESNEDIFSLFFDFNITNIIAVEKQTYEFRALLINTPLFCMM